MPPRDLHRWCNSLSFMVNGLQGCDKWCQGIPVQGVNYLWHFTGREPQQLVDNYQKRQQQGKQTRTLQQRGSTNKHIFRAHAQDSCHQREWEHKVRGVRWPLHWHREPIRLFAWPSVFKFCQLNTAYSREATTILAWKVGERDKAFWINTGTYPGFTVFLQSFRTKQKQHLHWSQTEPCA